MSVPLVWSVMYFCRLSWHWITGVALSQWFGVTHTSKKQKDVQDSGLLVVHSWLLDLSHVCELLFSSVLSVFQPHYCLWPIVPEGCKDSCKHLLPCAFPNLPLEPREVTPTSAASVLSVLDFPPVMADFIYSEAFETPSHSTRVDVLFFCPCGSVVTTWSIG